MGLPIQQATLDKAGHSIQAAQIANAIEALEGEVFSVTCHPTVGVVIFYRHRKNLLDTDYHYDLKKNGDGQQKKALRIINDACTLS